MHFVTGTLVGITDEDGDRMGKLRVGGAITTVELLLLPEARVGDTVLAHAGVALSIIDPEPAALTTQEP
jgi:hydrogenase maturation factor